MGITLVYVNLLTEYCFAPIFSSIVRLKGLRRFDSADIPAGAMKRLAKSLLSSDNYRNKFLKLFGMIIPSGREFDSFEM